MEYGLTIARKREPPAPRSASISDAHRSPGQEGDVIWSATRESLGGKFSVGATVADKIRKQPGGRLLGPGQSDREDGAGVIC